MVALATPYGACWFTITSAGRQMTFRDGNLLREVAFNATC